MTASDPDVPPTTSDKRIAANRENAKKSTGPKTPAGKARASRNSTRHGILSKAVVLDGESRAHFKALLTSLQDELQPQNIVEIGLIETMAVARWRQMRLWSMERANLALEIEKQRDAAGSPRCNPATRASMAFETIVDRSRALDLMNRYEARFDRLYDRALARLIALREKQ